MTDGLLDTIKVYGWAEGKYEQAIVHLSTERIYVILLWFQIVEVLYQIQNLRKIANFASSYGNTLQNKNIIKEAKVSLYANVSFLLKTSKFSLIHIGQITEVTKPVHEKIPVPGTFVARWTNTVILQ